MKNDTLLIVFFIFFFIVIISFLTLFFYWNIEKNKWSTIRYQQNKQRNNLKCNNNHQQQQCPITYIQQKPNFPISLPPPNFYYIGREKKIGYIIPKQIANNNVSLTEYSVFDLYKKQIDTSGYRFEYYVKHNGSMIFLIDPNTKKICQKSENPNGCNDFQTGDIVKLDVNNNEYIVNLY